MHEVLVNRLGGLSLSRKSVVRLTDRPDMTLDVCHGRKTTMQQKQQNSMIRMGYLNANCTFCTNLGAPLSYNSSSRFIVQYHGNQPPKS